MADVRLWTPLVAAVAGVSMAAAHSTLTATAAQHMPIIGDAAAGTLASAYAPSREKDIYRMQPVRPTTKNFTLKNFTTAGEQVKASEVIVSFKSLPRLS